MEGTNVEEESSVAAYGLVALCDQTFENQVVDCTQFSEEIVETTGDHHTISNALNTGETIYDGSIPGDAANNVVIEMEVDPATNQLQNNHLIGDGKNQLVIDILDMVLPKNFDPSSIIVAQDGTIEAHANTLQHLQLVNSEDQNALNQIQIVVNDGTTGELGQVGGEKEKAENENACYMLAALNEVGIDANTIENANGDVVVDGITEGEQIAAENFDGTNMATYPGNMLETDSYLHSIKSRQALLREAVEWRLYARMLLEKDCSEGANFYEAEVISVLKSTDDLNIKTDILSRITEKDMLQPGVQFWDFEKVYEMYGDQRVLNCPSCALPLIFVPFKQRFALRMLYDVERPILLVTSFLRCTSKGKKQHEILGYDPRLLRMFPNLDLPFMLFHKAGITKRMMDFIMENVIGGMTVNRLFDVIKTKYEVNHTITTQFFANEIETIRAHLSDEDGRVILNSDELLPPYVNCHPSKALLGRCFLASFKEREEYFRYCMHQLLANECIILDDSLGVGARIGIPGAWGNAIKMFPDEYHGMFLVFNEAKHILSWCFLKDCRFGDVQNILLELRDRHVKENISLKACFTTKCCEWRDDLRKIFGKWFIVKGNLRLFLDRICKEIHQEHAYYGECVNELYFVFREPNDTDEIRREYTPDPVVISHKIQEFTKRWKDVIDDRMQHVLPEKAIELIAELEHHIQAGCLSSIPPEVGDDNFTDIHNCLRKSVSHCRITVPLVSALFSMCLHDINRSRGAPVDFRYKPASLPKEEVKSEMILPQTEEGLQTVSIQTDNGEEFQVQIVQPIAPEKQVLLPASTLISSVEQHYAKHGLSVPLILIQSLMYYKYQEDFDAFAPQAIQNLRLLPYYSSALNLISHPAFPKEMKVYDSDILTGGLSEIEQKIRRLHVDIVNCSRLTGTTSDIFPIIARQLLKDRMCDNLSVDVLGYLKFLMSIGVQIIEMKERELVASLKNLVDFQQDILRSNKKGLVVVASKDLKTTSGGVEDVTTIAINGGDLCGAIQEMPDVVSGETNCLTTDSAQELTCDESVVAHLGESSLDGMKELKSDDIVQQLAAVIGDVTSDDPATSMENHLVDVNHHVANHAVKVEELTDNNLVELDQNKLTSEFESLDQSNEDFEVLRKLANKLGAVITVVTNLKHCWVIPIFPEKFCLYSPHFFVAYRYQRFFPAWLGNRASVSSIRNINLKRKGKEPQCRCGRGTPGKDGQGKCVSKENGKYLTRCICFRLDRGCSSQCDCRNCENPFGIRPDKVRPKKSKIPYRQRYAHEAAKIATCKSSSVSSTIATQTPVATDLSEPETNMENWVTIEHCIFEALINDIKSEENVITPVEVQETFNAVVFELMNIPELGSVAQTKTLDQISLKLQQRERDVSEYLKLYQMQVDFSLGG